MSTPINLDRRFRARVRPYDHASLRDHVSGYVVAEPPGFFARVWAWLWAPL
jgi:hypothetical protein